MRKHSSYSLPLPSTGSSIKLFCFGNNINGELGLASWQDDAVVSPVKNKSLHLNQCNYSIKQVAIGRNHTLILLAKPTYAFGEKETSESESLTSTIVLSCGSNEMSQLGRSGSWRKFDAVENLSQHFIQQISCGSNHNLVLTSAGQVFAWGCNIFCQLGLGHREDCVKRPTLVKKLALFFVVQVCCGGNHSLALTNDGKVYAWGSNARGQLGSSRKGNCEEAPSLVIDLAPVPVKFLSCGGSHSMALTVTSTVYVWGKNEFSQLGLGDSEDRTKPVLLESLRQQKICWLSCGEEHSAALTSDGGLFTWGAGFWGQLGHGRLANEVLPRRVIELMGTPVVHVTCGRCHTLAINSKGRLYAFGQSNNGQLGVGDKEARGNPTTVKGPWVELNAKEMELRREGGALVVKTPPLYQDDLDANNVRVVELSSSPATSGLSPATPHVVSDDLSSSSPISPCPPEEDELIDICDITDGTNEGCFSPGQESPRKDDVILIEEPEETKTSSNSPERERVSIDEYESDPDSDCESRPVTSKIIHLGGSVPGVPIRKNQLRLITATAGRGDHSFVIAATLVDDAVPYECIAQFPMSISHLSPTFLASFLGENGQLKLNVDLIEYIETTMSSVACWNSSFVSADSPPPSIEWSELLRTVDILKIDTSGRISEVCSNVLTKVISDLPSDLKGLDHEILRCFLILPQFLILNSPDDPLTDDQVQLATAFATAVLALSPPCKSIISTWLLAISSCIFHRLVQLYKNCVKHVLASSEHKSISNRQWELFNSPSSSYIHPNYLLSDCFKQTLRSSLEILKLLSAVNAQSNLICYKEFYIETLSDKPLIWMDYGYYKAKNSQSSMNRSIVYFCDYSFTLEPGAKMLALELDSLMKQLARSELYMVPTNHNTIDIYREPAFLDLHVHRHDLIQSTIDQLCRTDRSRRQDFKKMLRVNFIGEEAIDAGSGVKKEFFLLVMKEVLDLKYGMFTEYSETQSIWFNAAMNDMYNADDYVMYDMIGVICGLAIYNQIILYLPFPLPLYKKLLDEPLKLEDLGYLDPFLVKSLNDIVNTKYSEDEFNAIYADISFVILVKKFDTQVEDELLPGGSNKILAYHNRHEYVDLYWRYILEKSVEKQFNAFKAGFMKVVDVEVLKLFNAEELLQLIVGKQDYEWSLLEAGAKYKEPFNKDHPTIRLFWKVFHEMLSVEEKKKFLLFLTGSDRIPILGMQHLEIKFQPVKVDESHLPVAHTCFNLLDLPEKLTNEQLFLNNLKQAIEYTKGFSLA